MNRTILQENTINQLAVRGDLGFKRFDEVLRISREEAEAIVDSNEILYLTQYQIEEYDVTRLLFKRKDITDITPYGVYIEIFDGIEVITIQEIHPDEVRAKIICPAEDMKEILGRKTLVSECITDNDFYNANADMLDECKYIEGYFNNPEPIFDKNGNEISRIEHYDNYQYKIFGSERYMYKIFNQEKKQRDKKHEMERTLKYLKKKIVDYQKTVEEYGLRKIKRTIRRAPDFCNEVTEYNWNYTSELIRDMPSIAGRYKISIKRAWRVWKYLMVPMMQERIEELEDELGEYSINRIKIDTNLKRKNRVRLGKELSFHPLTGLIKEGE